MDRAYGMRFRGILIALQRGMMKKVKLKGIVRMKTLTTAAMTVLKVGVTRVTKVDTGVVVMTRIDTKVARMVGTTTATTTN
jgi:hypothetical protein